MKKLLTICTAMLITAAAFAQQALWGGSKIVSPEINEDNSVTFRLHAPKAVKVQVIGDFAGGEMVEKDGIWEFTTAPLAPELYSYSFVVDGLVVRDPSNVYMIRDVATVTNVFIIGGDRADLYKVQDVPHGSVSKVWYNSPTLGFDRRLIYSSRIRAEQETEISGALPAPWCRRRRGGMDGPRTHITDTGQSDSTG